MMTSGSPERAMTNQDNSRSRHPKAPGVGVHAGAGCPLTEPGNPTAADLCWGLLAGLGSGSGTAFLYRGLSLGRMGVVAPVSAVGAVLLPLAVGLRRACRRIWSCWM